MASTDASDRLLAFLSDAEKASLETPNFDMWAHDSREELVAMIEWFYHRLGFVEELELDETRLHAFCEAMADGYRDNPFHSFRHCFCVSHMVFLVLLRAKALETFLSTKEQFAVLVAANGHDLDHPALTNGYQVKARTELAMLYNDRSPLENHHCAMLWSILSTEETNIIEHFSVNDYKEFRRTVIACILATDMSRHFELLNKFNEVREAFHYDAPQDRLLLSQIIIMCCDISNEVRPWQISRPWADRLLEEFFTQTDLEKKSGLKWEAFMDRDVAEVESAQVGFVSMILLPLWQSAAGLLDCLTEFVAGIEENLEHWRSLLEHKKSHILVQLVAHDSDDFAGDHPLEPTTFEAGAQLVKFGDLSPSVFFINKGSVVIRGRDNETVWDELGEGCFFGEVGAFYGIPRTANIYAMSDCEIFVVDKEKVDELLHKHPEQAELVNQIAARRYELYTSRLAQQYDPDDMQHFGGG